MTESPYSIYDIVVLRTPLFPINYFLELTSEEKICDKKLKEEWERQDVQEAIYISSKSLYHNLIRWKKGEIKNEKKKKKLERVLVTYLIRMSTRCTPFGMFAGFSNIRFKDTTKIIFENRCYFERLLKLDFEHLTKTAREFVNSSFKDTNVIWQPNSTIYYSNKFIRYIESNIIDGVQQLTTESITKNKFLLRVLDYTAAGKSFMQLKQILIDNGLSEIDSEDFLSQLIKNQVLVSNLEPNLTGIHYSKILKDIPEIELKLNQLNNYKEYGFKDIRDIKVPIKIDLYKKTKSSNLDERWKKEISSCINFFNQITKRKKHERLEFFKKEFSKRFGTMEVPLGKVLDVEYGINYLNSRNSFENSSFISDFGSKINSSNFDTAVEWSEVTSILNEKVLNAKKINQKEIRLSANDFNNIEFTWDDLPTSMHSMVELATINKKDVLFMNSAGGKTAASIISRFAENTEISDLVEKITSLEQLKNKDKIVAEIVHVPTSKISNVLIRPRSRGYEIPFMGKSMVDFDKQIPISDLTITVRNGNIILKSKKLNKEVIPMLSCSHDYRNSRLAIYQFLCDVSNSGKTNWIGFDWGSLVSIYRYLPRVIYGKVIVSKARWLFKTRNCFDLMNGNNIFEEVNNWQEQNEIPAIISLIENEHPLTINLKNENSIEIFWEEIKKKKWFAVEEVLCCNETPVKDNIGGFYVNEFIISLGRKNS